MKPAVIIGMSDGLPECIACADIGEIHEQFRAMRKSGTWQGYEQILEISARGIEGKAKFQKPAEEKPAPKKRGRPRKVED